jgi:hypothetical protein
MHCPITHRSDSFGFVGAYLANQPKQRGPPAHGLGPPKDKQSITPATANTAVRPSKSTGSTLVA